METNNSIQNTEKLHDQWWNKYLAIRDRLLTELTETQKAKFAKLQLKHKNPNNSCNFRELDFTKISTNKHAVYAFEDLVQAYENYQVYARRLEFTLVNLDAA